MTAGITCAIYHAGERIDQKTVYYPVIPPAFVGNYVLSSIEICDTTFTFHSTASPLKLEIIDSFLDHVGFTYFWKIKNGARPRLGIPDSCLVQMPLESHAGYAGRYLQGNTRQDSVLYLAYPFSEGHIVVLHRWQDIPGGLILKQSGGGLFRKWHFQRR